MYSDNPTALSLEMTVPFTREPVPGTEGYPDLEDSETRGQGYT